MQASSSSANSPNGWKFPVPAPTRPMDESHQFQRHRAHPSSDFCSRTAPSVQTLTVRFLYTVKTINIPARSAAIFFNFCGMFTVKTLNIPARSAAKFFYFCGMFTLVINYSRARSAPQNSISNNKIPMKFQWNSNEAPMKLQWNNKEMLLKFLQIHWNSNEIPIMQWNFIEIPMKFQSFLI